MTAGELIVIVIVIGLIGFRAGRAVAMDDIGEPIRRLSRELCDAKPSSRARHWFVGLLKCVHCCGFWLSIGIGLIVTALLLDADWTTDAIIIAAATGLQSLLGTYAQADQVDMTFVPPDPELPSEEGKSDVMPP